MCENWKNVVDFEELYQISDLGNFRRHPDKQSKYKYRTPKPLERKPTLNRLGYFYVTLCKEGTKVKKTIHQLVAAAFIPDFEYGDVVNHLDGNKQNNCLDNLEISSHYENNLHSHKTGLSPKPGISKYHNVLTVYRGADKSTPAHYAARVKDGYKTIFYQYCVSEIDAALAVDRFLDSIKDTKRARNFP